MSAPDRSWFGTRVRVDDGERVHYGQLNAVFADGSVELWHEEWRRPARLGPVLDVTSAMLRCQRCGRDCNRVFVVEDRDEGRGWCADCNGVWARAHQAKPTCERCGATGGAVRNPNRDAEDTRIMCRRCHVDVGSQFVVPGSFVRESKPMRPAAMECEAANVPGMVPCQGAVRARGKLRTLLCNAHAGIHRTGDRR